MTRNALVPETVWNSDTASTFSVEAQLPQTETAQTFGCSACLKEGETSTPRTVYLINGTSLCTEHAANMV